MATPKAPKRRVVTSFKNLTPELQERVQAFYPTGYTEAMMRIEKPNGDFFYAVPFADDEVDYLVKIDVKIDDKRVDDDEKEFFDDDEIKEDDEINERAQADMEDDE